ncbi:MAG: helix-turn-helix domain-containing protein [Candidatus Omnitrophota bacterium]
MDKRFVGIPFIAQYLDISQDTLRQWVWRREIPYFKVGRLVKFDIIEIENWVKKKRVKELT